MPLARLIAGSLAAIALATLPAQEVKPKPSEIERLKQEAVRLRAEVEAARKLAEAKAEVEQLKKELADIKKGKVSPAPKKEAKTPKVRNASIEIRPRWKPPSMLPGEITVVEDHKGAWWFYELRPHGGEVSVHEFRTERLARDFVGHVLGTRTDFRFVEFAELKERPRKK